MTILPRKILVVFMGIMLIGSVFTPQSAQAVDIVHDPLNFIKNAFSAATDAISSKAILGLNIKEYVLDGIAWSIGQQLIQSLTGSVVNWINGRNGGGFSLYIQNLPLHLLDVGDVQALAFFGEFIRNSGAPFAATILSSIRSQYFFTTSAAGFWAANQCTLNRVSQDPLAFIAGDFRQGGWSAWFSLTQSENNPYSQFYRAQAELAARISAAERNALSQLSWGQGFLSWCGTSGSAGDERDAQQEYIDAGSPGYEFPPAIALGSRTCTKADGTPGRIQTPGSVIHGQLSQALGTTFDRLVSADELDEIVGALVQRLVTEVAGDGGLFGTSNPGALGRSFTDQVATASGSTNGTRDVYETRTAQILSYQNSWQTIETAANSAKSQVSELLSCPSFATAAQSAITNDIQPVIDRATTARQVATSAQAEVNRLRGSSIQGNATQIQNLLSQAPTAAEVAEAEIDAGASGGAYAENSTTLIVYGGSTVERMNLLSENARNALQVCRR